MTGASNAAVKLHRYQANPFQKSTIIIWVFAPAANTWSGSNDYVQARLTVEIHYNQAGQPMRHFFGATAYNSGVKNLIRFQPYSSTSSSQGMRGVLKHETLTGT